MSLHMWHRLTVMACLASLFAACAMPGDSGAGQDLEGTTWKLVEYGPTDHPIPALAGAPVTLAFEAGRKLGGSAGCNSYGGSYQSSGGQFSISNIASTMMGCEDPQRMQQEGRFLQALQTARSLQRTGETLQIEYDGGQLRFSLEV